MAENRQASGRTIVESFVLAGKAKTVFRLIELMARAQQAGGGKKAGRK